VPLRFYSLLRLRDGSWGTRKRRRGVRRGEHPEPVLPAPATVPAAAVQAAGPVPREPADDLPPVVVPAPVATGRACVDILAG
jgi:hypothetical protein